MGILSSIISGSFALGSANKQAKAQSEALEKQIEAQKEANAQQQAFMKSESELAYQRNSSKGQLQQLVAAGLSEQQARQVLASSGATGEYTPSESVNQMQGIDYTKEGDIEAQKIANLYQAGSDMTAGVTNGVVDALVGAFKSPDGGSLGAAIAAPFMDDFTENINLVDQSVVHNFVDFENWTKSLAPDSEAGKVFLPMVESNAFQRIKKFAPATKAFNTYMNDIYTSSLDSNQLFDMNMSKLACDVSLRDLQDAQKSLASSSVSLTSAQTEAIEAKTDAEVELIKQQKSESIARVKLIHQQVLGAKWQQLTDEMHYNRELANNDVLTNLQKQTALAQAQEAINNYRLTRDPFYFTLLYKSNMATLQGTYINSILDAQKDAVSYDLLRLYPEFNWATSYFDALQNCGALPYMDNKYVITNMNRMAGELNKNFNRRSRKDFVSSPDKTQISTFTSVPQ